MKGSSLKSRPGSLLCPLCGVHKLSGQGQSSARCDSCGSIVSGAMLDALRQITDLPDALGRHACEECGHPEMRQLPGGVFHCPGCALEVLTLNTSSVARKPVLELGGHAQQRRRCGTGRDYAIRRVDPSPAGTAGAGRDQLNDADLGDSLMISNLIVTRSLVQVRAATTISKARR